MRDFYVMVYNHVSETRRQSTKRFYQYLGAQTAEFEASIPLRPGMNRITVVARDDDDATSSEVIYVFRHE